MLTMSHQNDRGFGIIKMKYEMRKEKERYENK